MSHYSGSVPDTATRRTDWLATAPCAADPEAMFPGSLEGDIERAKSYCRRCPVVERCLQWALETGEQYGVYGGLTEAERHTLRQRPARPISIDEYAGTPKPQHPGRTLNEAWDTYTEPDGNHLLWTGGRTIYHPDGEVTPNRLSFYLDRGRWPQGDTKRSCSVRGCVKPAHLTDRVERAEEADLKVTA